MAKDYARAFYASPEWHKCRAAYIRKCGGLCEDCLKRGIIKAGKVVHHIVHITPENICDPSVTLSHDNLRLVCQDCHAAEHTDHSTYQWDADGRLIEM